MPTAITRDCSRRREDIPLRIWPLSLKKINGIGPKATAKLASLGFETIGIKLRYDDFRTVTRDSSLPMATDDPKVIRRAAGECLRRVSLDKKIRLLGVRASALYAAGDSEPVDIAAQTELPL